MRQTAQFLVQSFLPLCVASLTAVIAGEPPAVERLFPPGGQRGTAVTANVIGAVGDGQLQIWSARNQLTSEMSEKSDAVTITIPDDADAGVHWLRFFNEHGATDLRPFVVGLIPELTEIEPNNRISESMPTTGTAITVNGVLEKPGDVDVFGISLPRGCTLVAVVDANRTLGSPMDSVLELLNADGVIVAANDDDHGMDSLLTWDVPADGLYHVRVYAFPSEPNSTIRLAGAANFVYRLTMTCDAVVSHTVPAVVPVSAEVAVTLNGWNLREPRQRNVTSDKSSALITIAENLALPFTLRTADHPSSAEDSESPRTVAVPSSVTGVISETGEDDVWLLSGTMGQNLTLRVDARSLDSLLDPVLTVESEQGKVIKESDDRSQQDLDAEVQITLPADGVYSVRVTDRYRGGSWRHFYVLSCEITTPTFSATLKSNAFLLPKENTLELPVELTRNNGFEQDITVAVEGLSEGFSCEPVVSAGKGDSAKSVTLKIIRLEGPTTPFQGPVRIRCTANSDHPSAFAKAPIQNSTETTTEIWLTVPPAE